MGLSDVTEKQAVLKAIEEFDRLGREPFLNKYGFRKARRFFVQHDGNLYDSKPLLGAAHGYQYPERGPLSWDEFSGGETTTRRHLQNLGFNVVARDNEPEPAPDSESLPIGEIIEEVCALQQSWSKDNTPEMQERGRLVRREAVRTIRALLPVSSTLPFVPMVEGQDGTGLKARIPWVRVFSKSQSPSATTGWYVVLLFAADGSRAYLSLGTGTTKIEGGTWRLRSEEWLRQRVSWARSVIGQELAPPLLAEIHLADQGVLGVQYERGTVVAYEFPSGIRVDDEAFSRRLSNLLTLLSKLYSAGEPEGEPTGPSEPPAGPTVVTTPELTLEWLANETLWSTANLDELLGALTSRSPQVILAGPPGTGKSWVAQAVARYLTGDKHRQWRLVQFHPSYGYESFVEGLRPVVSEGGGISFERVDGTVLRMTEAARLDDAPHVLILDEMNRANVPRVLGELMFLFEYRGRMIDLQYSQGFALPRNLMFIATMNTADRSIRSIDVALRRRFEIFECLPDLSVLEAFYARNLGTNRVPDLYTGFLALNKELGDQLDRHHTIGQTFFMEDQMTSARLRRIWARKIFPLIEEYFFDLPDLAANFSMERFWPSLSA